MEKLKFVVVGLGYVGISNALLLARQHEVIGVDLEASRVDLLNNKISPLDDSSVKEVLESKQINFRATTDLKPALTGACCVIVSTPTNYDEEADYFDTSSVEGVVKEVISHSRNALVVIKSTIPVGLVDRLRTENNTDRILFSPEFLREGSALYDNLHPSRIIVGDDSEDAAWFAQILRSASLKPNAPIVLTGSREAESIKLFANTYLAMRVAFFNELDSYAIANDLCAKDIVEGVSLDPRIGTEYNNPSFGYGGYCLPKDSKQLQSNFLGVPQSLISATVSSNVKRIKFLAEKIMHASPKVVGVYRLAMKSGSDNFRETAVAGIVRELIANGIEVIIYEPGMRSKTYMSCEVVSELEEFKRISSIIIANRNSPLLADVASKVFCRDIYGTD